jgi:hypothetical protein
MNRNLQPGQLPKGWISARAYRRFTLSVLAAGAFKVLVALADSDPGPGDTFTMPRGAGARR